MPHPTQGCPSAYCPGPSPSHLSLGLLVAGKVVSVGPAPFPDEGRGNSLEMCNQTEQCFPGASVLPRGQGPAPHVGTHGLESCACAPWELGSLSPTQETQMEFPVLGFRLSQAQALQSEQAVGSSVSLSPPQCKNTIKTKSQIKQ